MDDRETGLKQGRRSSRPAMIGTTGSTQSRRGDGRLAKDSLSAGDEGTYTGAIGAGAVALWFLVLDQLQGLALRTPSVLGQVLLFGNQSPDVARVHFGAVVAYTALHVGAFLLFGVALVRLVRWARREPLVRYALLQVFLAFEVFFYGLLMAAAESTRALFPFWTVLGANTLAVLTMGLYLWRRHPEFRQLLRETSMGAGPLE